MVVVYFTPDSRSLIMCRGDEFSFWDVTTRKRVRRLGREIAHNPGRVAFTADGKLMALEMAPAVIHLKEVATGRTVAKLEDPHGDRGEWMGFTPDGTKLVVAARYARAIHVWDLRAIRQRLKAMGLDWHWPEFPPAAPGSQTTTVAKVEVLPGELAKPTLTREQTARQQIDHYRRLVAAKPNSATACNGLAWFYATAPAALRDVKSAVPLAENAVRLEPKNVVYRNTLGVVYYRAGRYREAVKLLRGNVESQLDWCLAFDLYFLAMSHQRLGEADRARDYYIWAVRWTRSQQGLSAGQQAELADFRAEAEGLFAVKEKNDR